MKKFLNILVIGLTALAVRPQAEESAPLRLVQTIPLTNVEGRIDHMAMDLEGQRLFVAALGNNRGFGPSCGQSYPEHHRLA